MKFTFDKGAMIKEISIAQEIISVKNAETILSNIYISAENNTLSIKATDKAVHYETSLPVQVQEEGFTTIFCDKFINILNSLPEGEIEFIKKTDDTLSNIIIQPIGKKIKFQMKCIDKEFPSIPTADAVPYFEVPSLDFKQMISQTSFAVSTEEARYFMCGVFLEKRDDNFNLVATDGKRLSFSSRNILAGVNDFPSAIVPVKILNIISKHAPDEGNISIAIVDKMIFFKFSSYKFASSLLEGQFPNYTRVIPTKQEHSFKVKKSDLSSALKRVALMADKKVARIYFDIQPGVLKITSPETDLGSADEEIPCQYADENFLIALNCRYIEEPLRTIDTDLVTFEFTEEMKAVTIKSEPTKDFFHIVMPMQKE